MAYTNRQSVDLIRARREFHTGNKTIFAQVDHAGRYVVYSYGRHFPMAVYVDGRWIVNSDRYSVTTTRHQGYVRQAVGAGYESADTAKLRRMLGIL